MNYIKLVCEEHRNVFINKKLIKDLQMQESLVVNQDEFIQEGSIEEIEPLSETEAKKIIK
jgi:hypothetical protein